MADETTSTTQTGADTGTTQHTTTNDTTAQVTTQTPEQVAAAAAEATRVAALTPEQRKAEEEAAAAEKKGAETKTDGPADYTKLTLPEGYKTDDPVFAEAVKLFESEKISPAQAQKLLDFTVERDKAIAKAVNDGSAANWTKQTDGWKEASSKEFSAEALGDARVALSQVFDKETITYLEGLGFTNHPGLIRGMVKVSQAIKDDSFVSGNAGRGGGALDPKSLYPNSQHN